MHDIVTTVQSTKEEALKRTRKGGNSRRKWLEFVSAYALQVSRRGRITRKHEVSQTAFAVS